MKQLMITAAVAAMAFGAFAENDAVKAELTKEVDNASIQAEFDQPDGAAISLKEDGSFAIFGRGTGTYDFDDVDDINDAKKEAVLKAKAAIAKYRPAAEKAHELGLGMNAGHDLNLKNLKPFVKAFPWTAEVSIGHAIVCDALYLGIQETIQEYLALLAK